METAALRTERTDFHGHAGGHKEGHWHQEEEAIRAGGTPHGRDFGDEVTPKVDFADVASGEAPDADGLGAV